MALIVVRMVVVEDTVPLQESQPPRLSRVNTLLCWALMLKCSLVLRCLLHLDVWRVIKTDDIDVAGVLSTSLTAPHVGYHKPCSRSGEKRFVRTTGGETET